MHKACSLPVWLGPPDWLKGNHVELLAKAAAQGYSLNVVMAFRLI